MIKELIAKLVEKQDLTRAEAQYAMNEIMSGAASDAQIAGFLTALRMKGETVDEITGCAIVMRDKVTRIKSKHHIFVDTCGTGGDKKNTFNISTCAAFVVAGAGVPVAKHGNKSVSSRCGSADVLSVLGVKIDVTPEITEKCLNEIGIGFIFAPLYHNAMKYAMPARQQLAIRTIFNILGPLCNPAGAPCQLLGVFHPGLTRILAEVLNNLGVRHAVLCHGIDGLDEITITGDSKVVEMKKGQIIDYYVEPADFGFPIATLNDIKGGTPQDNADILNDILLGKEGHKRNIVLMNAAAALLAADVVDNLSNGIIRAAQSVDSGAALQKLNELKNLTNS